MARSGRIRDPINLQAAMSSEQAAQRRASVSQMPNGAANFLTGPKSPTQQYQRDRFEIGPGRGANTEGSLRSAQQVSRQGFDAKSESVRAPSRTVRGYRG